MEAEQTEAPAEPKISKSKKRKVDPVEEERKRAEIMITKKNRWRYNKLKRDERTKATEVTNLMEKRKKIDQQERQKKKKKTEA